MLELFSLFLFRLNRVVGWMAATALAGLVIVVLTSVFFRYVLSNSLSWSGEFARYICIWIGFLSASIAMRDRLHIGLEVLIMRAPRKARWLARLVSDTAILGFLVFVTVMGTKLAFAQTRQISPALQISMFWPYLSVPVSSLIMALQTVHLIIDDLISGPKGLEV